MDSSTLGRMKIDARSGLGELGLLVSISLPLACAPPCFDDGVLQNGCPQEVATETATTGVSSSGTAVDTIDSADGTAQTGVPTGDGSASSDTGGNTCPGFQAMLAAPNRTFELITEQSGLMSADLDGVSRYDAIVESLFGVPDGSVTQQQSMTRFGMVLHHGLQSGCPVFGSVAPQLEAAMPMADLMTMNPPLGSNPMPESIGEALTQLAMDPMGGDQTLVILIGSEPGTCDIQSPVNAVQLAITRGETIDVVREAYAMGIPTRVISLGAEISAEFLQGLANAGQGVQMGDPDAALWAVQTREELSDAMFEITEQSRDCSFALDEPVTAEIAPNCEVVVNGVGVMYQDPDGWDLPEEQRLELQGAACDSIQQGPATINMVCVCDV